MRKAILFLRSLLFTIMMVIVTPIWACVCFLVAPFPYRVRFLVTSRWNIFIIWLAKVLCGIHYRVKGLENLPDEPLILLAKHQSAWETIILFYLLPRPIVFVFKRELLYIPFFGWALGLLRMIPIDRAQGANAFRKVVRHSTRRLTDGLWILMFPEGTRTSPGKRGKYRAGGTRLAIETNTRVVPIALNSGDCWPRNAFIKKPGMITISLGTPISPEGKTADGMMQEVEEWIEAEMRRITPRAYRHERPRKKTTHA